MAAGKSLPPHRRKQIKYQMKIKNTKIFTFCLSLLFFLSGTQNITAEEKTWLDNFIANVDTFQASFIQTLHNETGEKLETANGQVYMQKPGMFRWIYQQPYTQLIITDSKTLWLYDADLEQVTIKDISKSFKDTPGALILSGKKIITEHFQIINLGDIDGYAWFELSPKDPENQYSKIRMGFDKDMLGMLILFDNLGQITRIDFDGQKMNQPVAQELFHFRPPEGIDIIDDRDFSSQ